MVICLEQGAVLHMAQLMPLLLTVSCFSKIQIDFTFMAHLGSPEKRPLNVYTLVVLLHCLKVHLLVTPELLCYLFCNKNTGTMLKRKVLWL